ncbi:MAG: rRNA maturation RNase YbeY [Acidimicrobiales bacterium]
MSRAQMSGPVAGAPPVSGGSWVSGGTRGAAPPEGWGSGAAPPECGVVVLATDEQSSHPVDLERWRALALAVLEAEGLRGEVEVSLVFVDSERIAELNHRFLARQGPTDVLAFPIDDEQATPGDLPRLLGDVVICPEVAYPNAQAATGEPAAPDAYDDEMALLVVHGLLHLQGMDHANDADAEAMEARERELLAQLHRPAGQLHRPAGQLHRPTDATASPQEGP